MYPWVYPGLSSWYKRNKKDCTQRITERKVRENALNKGFFLVEVIGCHEKRDSPAFSKKNPLS